jgi:hypothetical protein
MRKTATRIIAAAGLVLIAAIFILSTDSGSLGEERSVTGVPGNGPLWSYQGAELFQDNFPSTDDLESYVRLDMAADISPASYPGIIPGDSVVVTCSAAGGLDTTTAGEDKVYFHCNVTYIGGTATPKPDLTGVQLEDDYGFWDHTDGNGWDIFLCEKARIGEGQTEVEGKYMIDLNDTLFTRGYIIEYYFKAFDLDGESTTLPENAESAPPEPNPSGRERFEVTCLPLQRGNPYILYVDDFDGHGTREGLVQVYFEPTFDAVHARPAAPPDRYDVNQPSARAGNSLGSRVRPVHLHVAYEAIFWDSGDLPDGTIISGLDEMDKSDDVSTLIAWLDDFIYGDTYPDCTTGGLVIMGDNVASDLNRSAAGRVLLNDWCGTVLVDPSYYEMTGGDESGGVVSPLITAVPDFVYDGLEFYLDGGGTEISNFDVVEAIGSGINDLAYPDYNGMPYYVCVLNWRSNSQGKCVATAIFGFSFMNIRNAYNGTLARIEFYRHTMRSWLVVGDGTDPDYTDTEIPAGTWLAGVYPNPFNPATRITFSLKKKGHVSMRVYDVSGRLVLVLVDEIREAGSYEVVWEGTNDRGRTSTSGIYFCRMEADDYEQTVKMVLLK